MCGNNEENDWKCIGRYKETEEIPDISFSSDEYISIENLIFAQTFMQKQLLGFNCN